MTLSVWLIFAALLAANALYVAAEFGAVGVRRSRIRRLSEDGNLLARRLQPFVEDAAELDRYVAASQIGITLSSLILGAYAQATATIALAPWIATHVGPMFHLDAKAVASAATITVLIVLTAVQVVAVELIPKSIALQFPTQVALGTVLPMLGSVRIFGPVIYVLNGATLFLRDSLLTGNTDDSPMGTQAEECFGDIISQDYNLIAQTPSPTGCNVIGSTGHNLIGSFSNVLDFQLLDHGGATGTLALLPGSIAIDAGDPTGCKDELGSVLTQDQRGVSRFGVCDIGAFEYQLETFLPLVNK